MTLSELIQKRTSIRDFLPKPIEKEKINQLLEAARLAPSAVNLQPWIFMVITSHEKMEKIVECYSREWIKTAPACILVCADHEQSWKRKKDNKDHADIDIAIATEHICLAATEIGLGSCWVCNFDADLCKKNFNLPKNIEPIVIIPIGYPTDEKAFDKEKKRKNIEDITLWLE